MTPAEFRAIRQRAGLTQAALARLLGFSDEVPVQRYEASACSGYGRAVSPAAARLMRILDWKGKRLLIAADGAERILAGNEEAITPPPPPAAGSSRSNP